MLQPDLITARLRLVAITPAMMAAEADDAQNLAPLLHARVSPEWPDSNWEPHVFTFIRQQYEEHPHTTGWHRYVVLQGSEPVLIGVCGAFPTHSNEAEIGYAILGPWQGHGYASEAAAAIIRQVFAASTSAVIAHTLPHLTASIRVMEHCGLLYDGPGDEAGTVRYRLMRPV